MNYNETIDTQNIYEEGINLVQASSGKRFLNFIIDIIFFYVCIFIISFATIALNNDLITEFEELNPLLDRLLGMLLLAIYYCLFEALTKGRTLGKLITNTKVVNEDGSSISFSTALKRSFSRIVPFEAFSALGSNPPHPWHDSWTKTYVVDLKASNI